MCPATVAFCYSAPSVNDSIHTAEVAGTGQIVAPQPSGPGIGRHLIAALFSAAVPGAGQMFLGKRLKGTVLLLVFVVLMSCIWPLRLPRFLPALIILGLTLLGLSCYAAAAALLESDIATSQRPPKWWLLAVLPMAYLGFNVIFIPLFLGAGFRARTIASSAMQPTLLIGDQIVFDNGYYHQHKVARNDLVVVRRRDFDTVKRVVAIGGDTIVAKDRNLIVNGKFVNEPFIRHTLAVGTDPELDTFGPIAIPAGKYFVMGDNRDVSLDSRRPEFGLTDDQSIIGRPLYVYRSPIKGHVGRLY